MTTTATRVRYCPACDKQIDGSPRDHKRKCRAYIADMKCAGYRVAAVGEQCVSCGPFCGPFVRSCHDGSICYGCDHE